MRREHFIWLVPILVGAVAYWRAEAMHGIGDRAEIAGRSSGGVRGEEKRFRSAAELDAELERVRNEARDKTQLFLDGIESMNVEKLKEELLRLKAGMDDPGWKNDLGETGQLRMRLEGMIHQLGTLSGESDLAWVRKNHPGMVPIYVEGWGRTKPEEALRYIGRSTQPGICSKETVTDILDRLGKKDPQALKSGIGLVPWDLFVFENRDPFGSTDYGMMVRIPDDDDAEVWWKSGAARDLAEEGVHIENLFGIWASKDPSGAISAWIEWPRTESSRWADDLEAIVLQLWENEEASRSMKDGLMKMDAGAMAKLRADVGRLLESHPPGRSMRGHLFVAFNKQLESLPPPP